MSNNGGLVYLKISNNGGLVSLKRLPHTRFDSHKSGGPEADFSVFVNMVPSVQPK